MVQSCKVWFFLIAIVFMYSPVVQAESESIVAFTRNHDLWLKEGKKETQLTHGEYVSYPKWSHDGKWIAYTRGRKDQEIWLYDVMNRKHIHPVLHEATNYQWAPNKNVLAFQFGGVLNIINLHDEDKQFKNVAFGAGNYSWLPDGKGFLVSSNAQVLPSGWTSVQLFTVPVDANMNPKKVKHFYTLPEQSDSFFAVSTSTFKWSQDKKWISFLAIPTASWSMDSDILCLLSSDGKKFEVVDKMIPNNNWFQWASGKNIMAYIEGEGRFAVENKHLKTKELPAFRSDTFTPKGFVDWDFTWHNDTIITVSRAKEAEWSNDPDKRPLPRLFQVNINDNHQITVTNPPKGYGDYYPYFLKQSNQLTWIRSNRKEANMWIANADGSQAKLWIKNIDIADPYYEKRTWNEILDIYK
ncbi:PD40 domain-containing protein [Bacillus sp. 165]|uniref:TolB family protein n=1 Tax=Bacillus sp. 165 TaxID=1529117 RepID=UPI001ADB5458|nr:PD40 domain-containing protein [Bacillus sp. 165]MBO9128813.1 PD40 domain-containing protein [Bacillus sp. 165]